MCLVVSNFSNVFDFISRILKAFHLVGYFQIIVTRKFIEEQIQRVLQGCNKYISRSEPRNNIKLVTLFGYYGCVDSLFDLLFTSYMSKNSTKLKCRHQYLIWFTI